MQREVETNLVSASFFVKIVFISEIKSKTRYNVSGYKQSANALKAERKDDKDDKPIKNSI